MHTILNFLLQLLASDTVLPRKLKFYSAVFKSAACVELVRKAADEEKIPSFNPLE
jgi:hypothetical protein